MLKPPQPNENEIHDFVTGDMQTYCPYCRTMGAKLTQQGFDFETTSLYMLCGTCQQQFAIIFGAANDIYDL